MPVRSTLELSVAYLPVILAGILFGPGAGGLVGLMCMAGDRDGPPLRWVVFASSRTISGVAAGWAALAATNAVGMDEMWQFVVVAVLSAVATMAVDVTVMVIVTLLRKPIPLRQFLNLIVPSLGLTASLYTPLVALYAFAYANAGMIVLAFLAIPLLGEHAVAEVRRQQRDRKEGQHDHAGVRVGVAVERDQGRVQRDGQAQRRPDELPQLARGHRPAQPDDAQVRHEVDAHHRQRRAHRDDEEVEQGRVAAHAVGDAQRHRAGDDPRRRPR